MLRVARRRLSAISRRPTPAASSLFSGDSVRGMDSLAVDDSSHSIRRFAFQSPLLGAVRETVEELYQKMLKSDEARTMPPNAWLWSLISSCSNREDIKLLFQLLQKLRIFRLSNLRIHSNFNCHLCMRVSEACTRANALDYDSDLSAPVLLKQLEELINFLNNAQSGGEILIISHEF